MPPPSASPVACGSADAPGSPSVRPELFVDLPRLAAQLDAVADGLLRRSTVSRHGFAAVVWDGEARAILDAHLDRLDADLAGIVAEIRERAAALRRDAPGATS